MDIKQKLFKPIMGTIQFDFGRIRLVSVNRFTDTYQVFHPFFTEYSVKLKKGHNSVKFSTGFW